MQRGGETDHQHAIHVTHHYGPHRELKKKKQKRRNYSAVRGPVATSSREPAAPHQPPSAACNGSTRTAPRTFVTRCPPRGAEQTLCAVKAGVDIQLALGPAARSIQERLPCSRYDALVCAVFPLAHVVYALRSLHSVQKCQLRCNSPNGGRFLVCYFNAPPWQ